MREHAGATASTGSPMAERSIDALTLAYRDATHEILESKLVDIHHRVRQPLPENRSPTPEDYAMRERTSLVGEAIGQASILIERLHPGIGEDLFAWRSRALAALRSRWLTAEPGQAPGWLEAIRLLEAEPLAAVAWRRHRRCGLL